MDSGLHFGDFTIQKDMIPSSLGGRWEAVDGFVNEVPNGVMNLPMLAFEPDPSRLVEMKLNVSETNDNFLDGITQKMLEGNFREEHDSMWAWRGPGNVGALGALCGRFPAFVD